MIYWIIYFVVVAGLFAVWRYEVSKHNVKFEGFGGGLEEGVAFVAIIAWPMVLVFYAVISPFLLISWLAKKLAQPRSTQA